MTLLHSQVSNSWKMLLLLLILVSFFFSCAWICVEMDDVSWLLCSIFGNNTFSLLYYCLFVYAHILAMVTSISIILFWLYFHIFHFFIFFISCIFCSSAERINEMMTVASWKTSWKTRAAQCGLFWPYSFRFALHPAIAYEVTCNWIGSTYWTKELKVACSGCHQNVSATSCLLFEGVKDVFMEHAC